MTQEPSKPASGKLWKQLLGILFAALFLWLAFRGADTGKLLEYLKAVQPGFLVLLCLSALTSHLLRALRWLVLLKPLSDHRLSLWNSFCAVMLGYAVNVFVPRGGEVARLVSISRSERLPWVGVLSTMFIDRLLDIAMLVLLLGFTLVAFPNAVTSDTSWLIPGGISLTISTLIGLGLLPYMATIIKWLLSRDFVKHRLSERILQSVEKLAEQFDLGTRSLRSPVAYPAIAGLTVAIWFFYWLNFYCMVWALNLQNSVDPIQCLIVFTIGSVGVLVPTPGSVGSFHFLVSQALVMVAKVNKDLALAYATILHAVSFIFVTCIPAAICVAIQSARAGKQPTEVADATHDPVLPAESR